MPLGQNLGNEDDVTELKWLLLSTVDVLNMLLSHSFGNSEKLGFAEALNFMVVFWLKGSGEISVCPGQGSTKADSPFTVQIPPVAHTG